MNQYLARPVAVVVVVVVAGNFIYQGVIRVNIYELPRTKCAVN